MRERKGSFPRRWHLALAALLGVAVVGLPAVASSGAGETINAITYGSSNYWSPSQVTVNNGDSVAFSNSSGEMHGVHWNGPPATPSCTGVPVDSSATSFKGTCTFSQAGTYNFYCTVHGTSMSGTVTVNANGTTTTTTTSTNPSPPPPTTTTTTTPLPAPESPLVGTASQALKLAKSQRGASVKGSIAVSKAGVGDRLEIDLFAQSASLAKAKHLAAVRVGRLVRNSLSAGKLTFSVKLNARARQAIKRHHRLALTVKVVLTPAGGKALTITRSVVQHP